MSIDTSRYIRKEFVVNEQEDHRLKALALDMGMKEATLFRYLLLQAERDYRLNEEQAEASGCPVSAYT